MLEIAPKEGPTRLALPLALQLDNVWAWVPPHAWFVSVLEEFEDGSIKLTTIEHIPVWLACAILSWR